MLNSERVERIMSKPVRCCGPDDPLERAAQAMWDHDCGVITVIGERDQVIGVITDRDICMAALHQRRRLADIPIRAAMSREVVACAPGDSIEAVESLMQRRQVRRIPAIDADGHPVGIVSLSDIVRDAQTQRRSANDRQVVDTLAAIGAPRSGAPTEARRAPPLA